jgi:hypothetical protein
VVSSTPVLEQQKVLRFARGTLADARNASGIFRQISTDMRRHSGTVALGSVDLIPLTVYNISLRSTRLAGVTICIRQSKGQEIG